MEEITVAEEVTTRRPRGLGTGVYYCRRRALRASTLPHLPPSPHADTINEIIDESKHLFLKSVRFLSKIRLTILVYATVDEVLPTILSRHIILGRGIQWCGIALTSWLVRERGGGGRGEGYEDGVDEEQQSDADIGLQRVEVLLE